MISMKNYKDKKERIRLARQLSQESIVLLKNNDNLLPLKKGEKIALFGRTQYDTIIGGSGSGSSYSADILQIDKELERAGLELDLSIKEFYSKVKSQEDEKKQKDSESFEEVMKKLPGLVASGAIYEIFGKYEGPIEEPIPDRKALENSKASIAMIVIGRRSGGEECDRHVKDDYYLTESENNLITVVTSYYKHIIVVFNINGACDMAWMLKYPQIKAALFMGSNGEQGAGALSDLLIGDVSPSAKLSQTMAMSYEDYPSAKYFSEDKEGVIKTYETYGLSAEENGSVGFDISPVTFYKEGIYVGYRYFDTFGKKVMYPFGYGLSYASFQIELWNIYKKNGALYTEVKVTNISDTYSGKEIVQLYITNAEGRLEQPLHQLKGFKKSKELGPRETEIVVIKTELSSLASFDDTENAYILEAGRYFVSVGDCLDRLKPVAQMMVKEELIVESTVGDIGLSKANKGKVQFLSNWGKQADNEVSGELIYINQDDIKTETVAKKAFDFQVNSKQSILQDVRNHNVTIEEFVNQLTVEELAVLCNGYGPGLPFGGAGQEAPSTIQYEDGTDIAYGSHKTAMPGYMNPAMKKYGIVSACYKDGPASVGKVAWPTGMMLGCTFNGALLKEFGNAIGQEAVDGDIQAWLAPGVNIIRNPIQGRAFEYFSEDPFLVGVLGSEIGKGVMEHKNITICPKHFAINEQETYRRGNSKKSIDAVDSIIDARTAREIYLKPFEMIVKAVQPKAIMTSFNKINGIFAAGNKSLCTEILREEWGFQGIVITDWGDMDIVVDGADAVAAGNDVVMPGGPPVIHQVLKGYKEDRVSLTELRTAVAHVTQYLLHVTENEHEKA